MYLSPSTGPIALLLYLSPSSSCTYRHLLVPIVLSFHPPSPSGCTHRHLPGPIALLLYLSPSSCTSSPLLLAPIAAIYLYSSFFLSIRLRPLDVPIAIYLCPLLLVPIALLLYLSPASSTHLPRNAPIALFFYLSYFTSILRSPKM